VINDQDVREPGLGEDVRTELCGGTSPIRVTFYERPHDKVMLVDARCGASTAYNQVVYAGSHNFTDQALTSNDELFLKIGSHPGGREIYDGFVQHFTNAWDPAGARRQRMGRPRSRSRSPAATRNSEAQLEQPSHARRLLRWRALDGLLDANTLNSAALSHRRQTRRGWRRERPAAT
jgi:phosphatidylserine/phosphatidylglycerophosphate/cardiolipin synthase-like enzyme